MATPFLLGDDEIADLVRLRDFADAHPTDMTDLTKRLEDPVNKRRHMAQMSKQTVYLLFGYAVTYSKEINHPGGRTARHMSMSVDTQGRTVPNQYSVWMVAEHLGFTGPYDLAQAEENLKLCDAVWLEDLKGHGKAVNVVQLLEVSDG